MKCLLVVLLIFVITTPRLCSSFNVLSYGARGDGQTDDSQAFVKAWKDVCGATQKTATLVIPKGKTFMLQPVSFNGPCKPATVHIRLQGTIIAPKNVGDWQWKNVDRNTWVQFSSISGLVLNGKGKVDGQGAAWWQSQHDVSQRPIALHFHNCQNLIVRGLTHINSPRNHISIDMCKSSLISNLHIVAPKDSPNTDGIDIAGSSNIFIRNSIIQTGDDCIAINSGSSFINITTVFCGPGHGISIGSLGKNGEYARVEEIYVRNCTFHGTTNGVRIKTWTGGSGYARKIRFEDIVFVEASNPVIINQHYSNLQESSVVSYRNVKGDAGAGAVHISDVTYRNVKGTASCKDVIVLNCDPTVACTGIVLDDISITTADGNKAQGLCTNAQGISSSCNPDVPCLSHH